MYRNKSNRWWSIFLLVGSLLGSILFAGCSSQPKADQTNSTTQTQLTKIRYSVFPGMNGMAIRMGVEKGFFAAEGLDVELIEMKDQVSGLTSGDLDFADMPTTNAIIGAGRGAPLKMIASMYRTKGPFYLIAKSDIKSIADLKGKKIGISLFGSGLEVYARMILEKNGINPEDVTFIANGSHSQAYASLQAGQVDATMIHEPFASLVEKTGEGRLLAKGWDYLPTFHTGVIASRIDFIDQHPDLVEKTLRAYFKSQDYAKSHQDEFLKYVLSKTKVERDVLQAALQREEVLWENKPEIDMSALNDTQNIQVQVGFQDKSYDLKNMVDLRFIPKKDQ